MGGGGEMVNVLIILSCTLLTVPEKSCPDVGHMVDWAWKTSYLLPENMSIGDLNPCSVCAY